MYYTNIKINTEKVKEIAALYISGQFSQAEIAKQLDISTTSVFRALKRSKVKAVKTFKVYNKLIGKTIKGWKILKKYPKKSTRVYFKCICIKCGYDSVFPAWHFTQNNQKKIGAQCKNCHIEKLWNGYGKMPKGYLTICQKSAKKRGLDFLLTLEQMWNLFADQKGLCALTGIKLTLHSKGKYRTASLDRINPDQGYIIDNVQWVHKDVNGMKWDLPQNEFIEICKLISQKFSDTDSAWFERENNIVFPKRSRYQLDTKAELQEVGPS